MRLYSFYINRHVLYVTSSQSNYYEQYFRHNRYYELAPPSTSEIARLHEKDRRLFKGALAAETKALRLRRQRQLIRDRFRVLRNYKMRNIAELEINEIITKDIRVILFLKALNSLSPRSSSFLNPTFLDS
jgi:hypothetical protein